MHEKYARYSGLLILNLMLYQICAENVRIVCHFFELSGVPPKIIDITNLKKKNELRGMCPSPVKITLEGASTLTMDGVDNADRFLDWLFFAIELEMCVSVENAKDLNKLMVETGPIVGRCEGPKLSIVNNINLKEIMIRNKEFGTNLGSTPKAIRIRGNQKLIAEDLEALKEIREKLNADWDLQPLGGLPINIENLRGIRVIEGRLILINNTGLNKFNYLNTLEKVGRSNERDVAVIAKDNGDLSFLELSSLLNKQLEKEEKQIELVNNPMLTRNFVKAASLYTYIAKGYTSVTEFNDITVAQDDSAKKGTFTSKEPFPIIENTSYVTIIGKIAAVASFVILCCSGIILVHRQKTSAKRLPQVPHNLNKSSRGKEFFPTLSTSRKVSRSESVSLTTPSMSSRVEQHQRANTNPSTTA